MEHGLLDQTDLPMGFEYPQAIKKIVELNLTNFEVWHFFDKDSAKTRRDGLAKRYPQRSLIPFARRDDNDDIACFENGMNDQVFIIHDFSSPGYEQRETYKTIWDWLRFAIDVMIENVR